MASNVIRFPHPWMPVEGKEMLRLRRMARAVSRQHAAVAIHEAYMTVLRTPALSELGILHTLPVILLAMRRAVRDLERNHGLPPLPEVRHG